MMIQLEEVVLGDVLLLSGRSALARLIRLIEGTEFDHVALVVPPNRNDSVFGQGADDDRTSEVWICDVGFLQGRWIPLSAYEERLLGITVRRHLLPVEGVAERAIAIAQRTVGYDWERLLYLTLIASTRWTHQLATLSEKEAAIVVFAFYGLLDQIAKSAEVVGERRICTEIIIEAYEVTMQSLPHAYLGLYMSQREHKGLLWWASGIDTFADFIYSSEAPPLSPNPGRSGAAILADIHEVATESGISFPGVNEPSEGQLRQVIIDGTAFALAQLVGANSDLGMQRLTDPRKLAWNLMDQIMRRRLIVTPSDMETTPTLVDVGRLCLDMFAT